MKRHTGQDRSVTANWRPATQAVRGGTVRSEFGETSEALFLTSGYAYDCAGDAAARFAGEQRGMTYSRLQNPTVEMLEHRIALMEGAEACRAMASGMAAMTAALLCQLEAGDHVVAGRAMFGSCRWLTDTLLPKFGISTTLVDARDAQQFADATTDRTKLYFFETPANPTMDVVDLTAVCDIARSRGVRTVVDNAFATPALQRPMEFGADIVAYSATKMMDGQGRVLAGAVCGNEDFIVNELLAFTRNTGPTLSAFNAWVVLKGLETLDMRARRQSENALEVGRFLEGRVPCINHPGLPSHPQHELAMCQMAMTGPIFSFEVDGGRKQAHSLLDALELIDISNNIGDSRSLMTHPASTTHAGVSEEGRIQMGISEGMLRLNVGLEDPADLIDDLDQALRRAGAVKALFTDEARTGAITVRTSVSYLPEQSEPERGRWFWAYHIRIENDGDRAVRLQTRHWVITDGRGERHSVEGEGVVGEQPLIEPGGSFDYVSGCHLTTPTGHMQGNYRMIDGDGAFISVAIPRFALVAPAVAE